MSLLGGPYLNSTTVLFNTYLTEWLSEKFSHFMIKSTELAWYNICSEEGGHDLSRALLKYIIQMVRPHHSLDLYWVY